MSTNPETPRDGADGKAEQNGWKRVERLAGKGLWLAAFATMFFNKPLRKGIGRTLFGAKLGAERVKGFVGDEVIQLVGVGWTLIELRWLGLFLLNLWLYWTFPVWGPLHVISNLLFFIVAEHFANAWMLQRIMTFLTASAGAGFVAGLDGRNWKSFWNSLPKALSRSGETMSYATWEFIHKIANEQHYFGLATFIGMFWMAGATGLPWAIVPAAGVAAYILWKISTSIGNNKTAEGDAVLTEETYNALRRKRDEKGKLTFEIVKGRKFALPRLQANMQTAMSAVIALSVLLSWGAAFTFRNDVDHDGLSNIAERVYYKTDWKNPDTDGDELSDSEEVRAGLSPTYVLEGDPRAKGVADKHFRDKATADSLRELYSNPLNWGKVIPKGEVGPFNVRYATPDSMPTQGVSQATINLQNWTDAMMRNAHGSGSSLVDFMVRLGAVLFLVWLGATFAGGVLRILAFLVATTFLVLASGLIWIAAWPVALLVAMWFFAKFKPRTSSSNGRATAAASSH